MWTFPPIALVVLVSSFTTLAAVQSPRPAPAANGLIAGQVVDAITGQPVSRAVVRWYGGPVVLDATIGADGVVEAVRVYQVVVDTQGRFVISGLPAAAYTLSIATPTGYDEAFASVKLDPNERVTDVLVRMRPHGSISGTIRDETGDPVVGIPVTAYLKMKSLARTVLLPKGLSPVTDDRGQYRINDLAPGSYFICACDDPLQSLDPLFLRLMGARASSLMDGDGSPRYSPVRFIQTLHPGSPNPSAATPVGLTAGEDRAGVDIDLPSASTSRVSGRLEGVTLDASRDMVLMLVPNGDMDALGATMLKPSSVGVDGAFEFAAVPPGTYSFEAFPKDPMKGAWASVPIAVGNRDVTALVIPLKLGPSFSGYLDFKGTAPRPTAESLERSRVVLAPIDPTPRVMLSNGAAIVIGQWASVGGDGAFKIDNLPPGRYQVIVPGLRPWSEEDAIVTIGDQNIESVPVKMTSEDEGGIEARLELDRYESPEGIKVMMFSADPAVWADPIRNSRYFSIQSSAASLLLFSGIRPGDYFVTREVIEGDWTPETLGRLAGRATRVTVRPGETAKVTIRR